MGRNGKSHCFFVTPMLKCHIFRKKSKLKEEIYETNNKKREAMAGAASGSVIFVRMWSTKTDSGNVVRSL